MKQMKIWTNIDDDDDDDDGDDDGDDDELFLWHGRPKKDDQPYLHE